MFGRCRGGLHADSCQRDALPVVRTVGVVPGAISARGQPPRCNIHAARSQIHSRARAFFLTFASHGVLLKERTAPIRGRRRPPGAAFRPLARHRRAAPGNAPRISDAGTPDAIRRDTSCRQSHKGRN